MIISYCNIIDISSFYNYCKQYISLDTLKKEKEIMIIYKVSLLCLISIAMLIMNACTTIKPTNSIATGQWQMHKKSLQKISTYQIRGSLSYLFHKKKIYVRFLLQQFSPQHYRMLLTNQFGRTELDIKIQPNIVKLTDHKGNHYLGDNPEEMIHKLTGIEIPIKNLFQWMLGLPGESKDFTLDNRYYLRNLTYQNSNLIWIVDYQDYRNERGMLLPIKLELKQGDQYIKIKIDRWTLK